jgi:hypothetical protein
MTILFLDAIWLDANLTFRKCWQSKDAARITTNENASNRHIIVHMGGYGNLVEGCVTVRGE